MKSVIVFLLPKPSVPGFDPSNYSNYWSMWSFLIFIPSSFAL